MKNALIIDDEKSLLFSIKKGFETFKDELNIITAENGVEAVKILATHDVDLVVTDLKMPEMDGFELIVHLSEHYPGMPIMVMTAFNTPEIEQRLTSDRTMTIFEKPVNFDEFSKTIIDAVRSDTSDCPFGISISSFMQLIQSEQKTCLLEVKVQDKSGIIHFENGELINASFSDLNGENAIYRMMEYQDIQIGFKKIPKKKVKRSIHNGLMQILMEGMRRIDDQKKMLHDTSNDSPETDENDDDLESTSDSSDRLDAHSETKKTLNIAGIKESLEKFKAIDGFMASGVLSHNGELIVDLNLAGVNIAELGALASDMLRKAQTAAEVTGFGRSQLVYFET